MKRLLSALLCLAMILSVMTLTAQPSQAADLKVLQVTVRDFKTDENLLEGNVSTFEGLVRSTIGENRKPDFSDPLNPAQPLPAWKDWTNSEDITLYGLNALFSDAPGINMAAVKNLNLIKGEDGFYALDKSDASLFDENGMFFPIDNQLLGNEENAHNSNFTLDLHARFDYKGSEQLTFEGNGDVWVFINGQLVIASSGNQPSQSIFISLHKLVSDGKLDIVPGQGYDFDMFYMAHNASESSLNLSTNINLFNLEYGKVSSWAAGYLDDASIMGLIPNRLKGADMTVNITREEFAETAVKFYEMVTGKAAQPANKTFKDCSNPEVLKAYGLNITAGVGDGSKFAPNSPLPRQQMATMIVKTLQACYTGFFIDTIGQADFKDQKLFASYAVKMAKFMAKYTITAGDGKGNFSPTVNCTRQEALTFLVKAFEVKDEYIILHDVESTMQNGIRVDKTGYPFETDDSVLGYWKAVDLIDDPLTFDPTVKHYANLNTVSMFFNENGKCDWIVYFVSDGVQSGDRTKTNDYTWTKGLVMQDYLHEHTSARYFITKIKNIEYLFVEFKNGDYVYRDETPGYHVFVRE